MALAVTSIQDGPYSVRRTVPPILSQEKLLSELMVAVLAALVICRVLLAAFTDLSEDEAYYWLWSRHLASGYYDHPPMIAWWIRAGTFIFGDNEFGVRFVGLLSVLGGSWLLYRSSLSLFRDASAAALSVIWLNATLFCNAASLIATPDTPLAFFCAVTFYGLAKLIETGKGAWWYAIGAGLGAAFLSKYTAALLLPGLFLWMIATPVGRRWLPRPEPYLGALIALAIIAPMVHWNYAHDWASFAKQAHHGVKDKPVNAIASVGEFIGGQVGLVTPLMFGFCLFGCGFAVLRGWRKKDAGWLLLAALTVPPLAFFFIHSASQKIQPNWPGFLYAPAILAAVQGVVELKRNRKPPRWVGTAYVAAPTLGLAISAVAFLQLGFAALPIPAKQDPTSRLRGWAKLGADVERLRQGSGAAFVLTDRYAATGELGFYTRRPDDVLQLNERIRYSNFPAPPEAKLKGASALLFVRKGATAEKALPFFEQPRLLTTLERDAGYRARDAYDIYLLTSYRGGLFGGS